MHIQIFQVKARAIGREREASILLEGKDPRMPVEKPRPILSCALVLSCRKLLSAGSWHQWFPSLHCSKEAFFEMQNTFTGVSSNSCRCVASLRLFAKVLPFLSFPKRLSRIIIRPIASLTHAIFFLRPHPSVSQG